MNNILVDDFQEENLNDAIQLDTLLQLKANLMFLQELIDCIIQCSKQAINGNQVKPVQVTYLYNWYN